MYPADDSRTSVKQCDLLPLFYAGRLVGQPVVVRSLREAAFGGFANPEAYPNAWIVYFDVDGAWVHLESARGIRREWSSLDRLQSYLLALGYRSFLVKNDLELPLDSAIASDQGF